MKPFWKWTLVIIGGIIFLVLSAGWYLSRHWKPLLDTQIREVVLTATDSLYRVEYEDLSLNLFTGSAKLTNFSLISDSAVYARMESQMKAPDNRFEAMVSLLRIRGLNIRKAIFSKELDLTSIIVDTPKVILTNKYHHYNDTVSLEQEEKSGFLGSLNAVRIRNVDITGIHFIYDKLKDTTSTRNEFKNVRLNVDDILIDSAAGKDPSRFYYTRSIALEMGSYQLEIADSQYDLAFDSLYIRTDQKKLVLQGLKYAPRVSKQEFYREIGYAKDIIQLWFEELTLQEMDLARFMRTQRVRAGKLYITGGTLDVSNDLRYPRRPVSKIGKSPHQQLMKLDHPVKIDSIFVDKMDISYAEISGKYHKEGKITFERTHGVLSNVTNDSISLQSNHIMEADLTSYLMNTGKLHAQFTFDMFDKQGAFTYKGTLGPMNGRSINRILTPLLSVEAESANIKGVRFDMQGNDYRNWGNFWFDYDNMKVGILETEADGSTSKKKLVSFLANELLLNDSNPNKNGVYLVGKINYKRPHEFSFFKTLWKSLLEGIKQTAGISKERETRMMNTAETAISIKEKAGGVIQSIFRKRNREEKGQEKKDQDNSRTTGQ